MFEWYFKSIVIYIIVMYCTNIICSKKAKENGWIDDAKLIDPSANIFVTLFCMSAVPVARLLLVVFMFVAALCTKEQLEEWRKKIEEANAELDLDYYDDEDVDEYDDEDLNNNN